MGLQFNGTNQAGQCPVNLDFSPYHALMISLWMQQLDASPSGEQDVAYIGNDYASGSAGSNGLILNGTRGANPWGGKLGGFVVPSGTSNDHVAVSYPAAGWHHVVLRFDQSAAGVLPTMKLSLDGSTASSTVAGTTNGGSALASLSFQVGAYQGLGQFFFHGMVSQIAIWGAANMAALPTDTDVTNIYNSGTAVWSKVGAVSTGAPQFGWTLADATGTAAYGGTNITWSGSPTVVPDPSVSFPDTLVVPASHHTVTCWW